MNETHDQDTSGRHWSLSLPSRIAGNGAAHRAARATRTLRHAAIGCDISAFSRARILRDGALALLAGG